MRTFFGITIFIAFIIAGQLALAGWSRDAKGYLEYRDPDYNSYGRDCSDADKIWSKSESAYLNSVRDYEEKVKYASEIHAEFDRKGERRLKDAWERAYDRQTNASSYMNRYIVYRQKIADHFLPCMTPPLAKKICEDFIKNRKKTHTNMAEVAVKICPYLERFPEMAMYALNELVPDAMPQNRGELLFESLAWIRNGYQEKLMLRALQKPLGHQQRFDYLPALPQLVELQTEEQLRCLTTALAYGRAQVWGPGATSIARCMKGRSDFESPTPEGTVDVQTQISTTPPAPTEDQNK